MGISLFVSVILCLWIYMCVRRSNSIANRQPSRYNEKASEQMKVCDWRGSICHRTGSNLIGWCLRRLSGNTGNESEALAGCTNFTWFVFPSVYRSGYVQIVSLCRAKFYFFTLTHGSLNIYAAVIFFMLHNRIMFILWQILVLSSSKKCQNY